MEMNVKWLKSAVNSDDIKPIQCDKQFVKTVVKLVKLHILGDFLLSKHTILKKYSMLYSDIKNMYCNHQMNELPIGL